MPDEELFQYILRKSALESRQQAAATASRKMSAAPRNLISDLDINHVDSYSLSNHGNHEYSSDDYQQDEQAMTSRSRSGVGVYSSRDSGRYSTTANNDEDSSSSVPSYRAKYQRSTSEGSTVMATRLGMLGLPSPTQPAETSYRSQTSSTYSSSLMSSGRDLDPGSDTVRGPWGRRREALASQQAAEGKMTSSMSGRTEVKPRRRIARGQTEGDAVLSIRTPEQTTEAAERAREWLVAEQNGSLPAQGGRDSSIFFRSRRRALSSDLGQAHPAGTTQLTLFDTGDNNFSIDSKYTTARDLPAPVRDYTPRYTRYSSTSDYAADLASRFPLAHGNRSAAGDGDGASRNGQYDLDRDQAMLENQQVTGDTGVEMLQENTEDVDHDQVHVHSYTDTTASSTSVLDSVSTPTSHTSNIPSSPLPAEKDKEMPARVVPDAEVMPSGVVEETGSDALLSRSNSYRQKIAPRAARQRVSSRSAPDGDNSTPGTPALTPGVASAQVSSVTSTTDSKSPSHTNSPRQTNGTGASYSNGNDVTSPRTAAAKQADESQKELSPTTSTALPENKTVSQSSRATARTDRVDTTTDRQPPASSRQKGTTTTTTTTERRAATNDDSEQRAARLARSTRLQPADMLLTGTNTVPAPNPARTKASPRPSPSSAILNSTPGRSTPARTESRSTTASSSGVSVRSARPSPASSTKPTPASSTEALSVSPGRRSSGPVVKPTVGTKSSPSPKKPSMTSTLTARSSRTSSRATSPAPGTSSNLSSTADLRPHKVTSDSASTSGRSSRASVGSKSPTASSSVTGRLTNSSNSNRTVTSRAGRI